MNVAVYGSLKKGKYNHNLIGGCELLGEATVKGDMYSLGTYPALVDEGDTVHKVEVYDLSEAEYDRVKGMELGAGYQVEVEEFKVGDMIVAAIIFYATDELKAHCKKSREIINSY